MNHLFNAGKSLFKKNKHGDDESGGGHSSSGGGGLGNPMAILKTFDRDGDGEFFLKFQSNVCFNYHFLITSRKYN